MVKGTNYKLKKIEIKAKYLSIVGPYEIYHTANRHQPKPCVTGCIKHWNQLNVSLLLFFVLVNGTNTVVIL